MVVNRQQSAKTRGGEVTQNGASPVVLDIVRTLRKARENGRLLLGLDRDGTLVPIADRPEEARVDATLIPILEKISRRENVILAVVSARSIAQLRADFPNIRLIIAGNYGMEIQFPDQDVYIQPEAAAAVHRLKTVRNNLAHFSTPEYNAVLEDHGLSLCLHWHTVPTERRAELHERLKQVQERYQETLRFHNLPTSYEVVPPFDWDKGRALEQINCKLAESGQQPRSYGFFGDSVPDEAAFAWVNARGGISVKVGSAGASTCSLSQVSDTNDVRLVLELLASD